MVRCVTAGTHGIHIAHISCIYKSARLHKGDFVAIILDIGTQAVQNVGERVVLRSPWNFFTRRGCCRSYPTQRGLCSDKIGP